MCTGLNYFVHRIVMSMSFCLFVRLHNSKTTLPNFTRFLCILPMVVYRTSSLSWGLFSLSGGVLKYAEISQIVTEDLRE